MPKQTNKRWLMMLLNAILIVILMTINIFLMFQQKELIANLLKDLFDLNVNWFIVTAGILMTITIIVLSFNILKVLFKLSFDSLNNQEILCLFLLSNDIGFILIYVMQIFLKIPQEWLSVGLASLSSILFLIFTNIFLYCKEEKYNKYQLLKLNAFLIIYGVINVLVIFWGNMRYVVQ